MKTGSLSNPVCLDDRMFIPAMSTTSFLVAAPHLIHVLGSTNQPFPANAAKILKPQKPLYVKMSMHIPGIYSPGTVKFLETDLDEASMLKR